MSTKKNLSVLSATKHDPHWETVYTLYRQLGPQLQIIQHEYQFTGKLRYAINHQGIRLCAYDHVVWDRVTKNGYTLGKIAGLPMPTDRLVFLVNPNIISDTECDADLYQYYDRDYNDTDRSQLRQVDDKFLFTDFPNSSVSAFRFSSLIGRRIFYRMRGYCHIGVVSNVCDGSVENHHEHSYFAIKLKRKTYYKINNITSIDNFLANMNATRDDKQWLPDIDKGMMEFVTIQDMDMFCLMD